MKILVENRLIETKDIADIVDIEANKKMFLNREAGFKIIFLDGSEMIFKENIPYESYPIQITEKKEKWERLQKEVEDKWQKDKHNLEEFNFQDNH